MKERLLVIPIGGLVERVLILKSESLTAVHV